MKIQVIVFVVLLSLNFYSFQKIYKPYVNDKVIDEAVKRINHSSEFYLKYIGRLDGKNEYRNLYETIMNSKTCSEIVGVIGNLGDSTDLDFRIEDQLKKVKFYNQDSSKLKLAILKYNVGQEIMSTVPNRMGCAISSKSIIVGEVLNDTQIDPNHIEGFIVEFDSTYHRNETSELKHGEFKILEADTMKSRLVCEIRNNGKIVKKEFNYRVAVP